MNFVIWSCELFGKWRHDLLAKGKAHKAAWLHENYLGLMVPCLWLTTCMHGFGTELIRNLAIWLAVSQDYHLFICKVYWYILSMFVPIFTSFGIENSSLHSGRPRKLLPLISLSYFFLFHDPRVSTRGIASIIITKNIRYLLWNGGFWRSLNNTYPIFLTPCIGCTNHLCDSCDLTDVNPHFIPSLPRMIQNIDLLWRHRYKSQPPAIVTSQWSIVPAWLLWTFSSRLAQWCWGQCLTSL